MLEQRRPQYAKLSVVDVLVLSQHSTSKSGFVHVFQLRGRKRRAKNECFSQMLTLALFGTVIAFCGLI